MSGEFLPETEPLPPGLIAHGDLWQRGLRISDRAFGNGRITSGLWASGVFTTQPFVFDGQEWMHIISGRVTLEIGGIKASVGPGEQTVVAKGLRCLWIQPEPVLKLFVRWEGDGPPPEMAEIWSGAIPHGMMNF